MIRDLVRRGRRALTGSHRSGGGIVLAYHRVAALPHDRLSLAVEPARFREHLDCIRGHFTPMRLSEMVRRALTATLPPRAVAVTFDDGYRDVLRVAAPLLVKAGVPATVFITTSGVERGTFWWEAGITPERPALSTVEIEELSRIDGITIGSHTHRHLALSGLSADQQRQDIVEGRERLETVTGLDVTEFAYPFGGRRDFTRQSVDAVRAAGVTIACSTIGGTVHEGIDPLRVPRIVMHNWSGAEFARRWATWA